MAIKIKKQVEPATDGERCQFYEDVIDGHVKAKNSSGSVIDLQQNAEGSVFGTEYSEIRSTVDATTGSGSFQPVLTLNTEIVPTGKYLISFFYNWGYSTVQRDFVAQIMIDDKNVIMVHQQEPKDPGVDQRNITSGSIPVELTQGSHKIELQYRAQQNGDTARIYNMNLQIWRVE